MRHSTLEYRPAIDGLRGVAVLSVFLFHLNHRWLRGGFVGVDIFFVISGYLITSIIAKQCREEKFTLAQFYQRRIARIFPAFFLVALVTVAGAWRIFANRDLAVAGNNLAAAALSLVNMVFMLQGDYFKVSPDSQPFLHYWSLSVEEQFYIFFPLLFLLLYQFARGYVRPVLLVLWVVSFAASVAVTYWKPVWAFYLLPMRAWELLTGCWLAVSVPSTKEKRGQWGSLPMKFGLVIIAFSFFLINERSLFPGFWALLPVAGAGLILYSADSETETKGGWNILTFKPLIWLGQISYSLYLWHWPVFSLVDYKMYLASDAVRLALKISISLAAAVASFHLVENPGRIFLNRRSNRKAAYAFMVTAIVICVPLGYAIERENYVNARLKNLADGGVIYNPNGTNAFIVLMGDSDGSMYGKLLKDLCVENDFRLTVLSVSALQTLPNSDGSRNPVWEKSLPILKAHKPDCVVLGCNWIGMGGDREWRIKTAVDALKPLTGKLILMNQPPILPAQANREAMREGARSPFFEEPAVHQRRLAMNQFLASLQSSNCVVIDVGAHFERADGPIIFFDARGRENFYDPWHLTAWGTESVRDELLTAINTGAMIQK